MTIGWFPGHMAKARRAIGALIPTIDVVIELLDARLPRSSANPLLADLRGAKPCVKLLNKSDLADPTVTKAWVAHFEREAGTRALPVDARKSQDLRPLPGLCRRLVPHRGGLGKPVRVLVIGIPNVGKSTIINTLGDRPLARVGDRPAITRDTQQFILKNGLYVRDTPGLLWPALTDQAGALRLAASGAIGENAFDPTDVAHFALGFLARRYPAVLASRYKLADVTAEPHALLAEIARRRGCSVKGGGVDLERAAGIVLTELRAGTIGRVSLEEPSEPAAAPPPEPESEPQPAGGCDLPTTSA
jgi:ribosome biogenesis GTPase A